MPNSNEILAVILGGVRVNSCIHLRQNESKTSCSNRGKVSSDRHSDQQLYKFWYFKISVLTQFCLFLYTATSVAPIILTISILAESRFGQRNKPWKTLTGIRARQMRFENRSKEIRSSNTKHVLILAGDHLYRMDYAKMAEFHIQNNADITVAVQPVPKNEAFRFGILKRDEDGRITRFAEKPKDPVLLAELVSRDDPESPYLGSMGIYMFRMDTLMEVLRPDYSDHKLDDFGGDIIPSMIQRERPVYGFNFEGYWRDIGTIRTFYETNLELAEDDPAFDFYDPKNPIFTHPRFLPGSRVNGCSLKQVLMAEGSEISAKEIEHSVIGLRSVIGTGTIIRDTIVMGADWYGTLNNGSPLGIGRNCNIQGAIIDKNASIGDNVVIKPFPEGYESDHKLYKVREGIVVVPKHTTIPAGTVIQP